MHMDSLIQKYKAWRFRNTALLALSIVVFFVIADTDPVRAAISHVGSLGYFGSLIAGMFFVLTFTVAPAGLVLFYLADTLNPLGVALTASIGGVLGDFLIFRFLKDRVFEELSPVFMKLGGSQISRILSTPYFAWLLPVLGALIIISPFPDEMGVGLLGLSSLKSWQFLAISFLLNILGMLLIVILAQSV